MLGSTLRRWWPLCLSLILLTGAFAAAQDDVRLLAPGSPLAGVLDSENIVQMYVYDGAEGDALTLTASNEIGVPLAIAITDANGNLVVQGVDEDTDGLLTLTTPALPADGLYYVTVFKAGGIASVNRVVFTLEPELGTATPEATAEPTDRPVVETTPTLTPETTAEAVTEATPEATAADTSILNTTSGIEISLTWNTTDDLDLEVRDPVGGSLYWETPTVNSGGTLSPNVNQGCAATTAASPTETAVWSPGGVPTGSYEVLVYYQQACDDENPVTFSIEPVVDGLTLSSVQGTLLPGQVFVTSFVIAQEESSLTGLSGIVDEQVLPASAAEIIANAEPVVVGTSLNATITNQQPYQSYSFEGQPNDLVSIAMDALSGSLDTYLALLDPSGQIIRFNDDAGDGITNSSLNDVLLPSAGTYTIVATRYAKQIGGTEGDYVLTVVAQATDLPEAFANLPTGALEFRLLWDTSADIQLLVRDPSGEAVFDDAPQVRSGGQLAAAGNRGCVVSEGTPFSYVYWPSGIAPRAGVYEVEVWFQSECGDTRPVNFNLYVRSNGREVLNTGAQMILNERYLTSFTLNADGSVILSDGGIIRGLETLDFETELEDALAIVPGEPINGSITQENKFDVFVFTATAGQRITVAMNATSGTLDTTLYLVGPSGATVAENDDAVPGENTNSLINDLTLPETGQYIIIATHFGARYGGTTGTYTLTLTQLS